MPITVKSCASQVRLELGDLPRHISVVELVNLTGNWFTAVHQWKYLQRSSASLDFVVGQDYVALPADFKSIVSVETAGLTSGIDLTVLERVLELRKNSAGATNWFECAVEWDHSVAPPTPRLAIWPTPTAAQTGALTVYYRARWPEVTSDNDTLMVPWYAEGAFIQAVRAHAAGYEESNNATLEQRLAMVMAGPTWIAARKNDAQVQPDYGPIQNGIGQVPQTTYSWRDVRVPGPS